MSDEVKVKGLSELQALLNTLPAKLEANVMRSAMRAGAKVIAEEAKQQVSVKSGALRDSIKVSTSSRRGVVKASIKAGGKNKKTGGDAFYAHMVEFGTAPHFILGPLKLGKGMVAGVKHPGSRAHPFMRPAFDKKAQQAVLEVGKKVRQRLSQKHGLDTSGINLELED
jgi:HK97 gp10 family phage protein